jgi:hypothetical protein
VALRPANPYPRTEVNVSVVDAADPGATVSEAGLAVICTIELRTAHMPKELPVAFVKFGLMEVRSL